MGQCEAGAGTGGWSGGPLRSAAHETEVLERESCGWIWGTLSRWDPRDSVSQGRLGWSPEWAVAPLTEAWNW